MHGVYHFLEVVTTKVLVKPACLGYEVEEFAASCQLNDDVVNQLLCVPLYVVLLVVVKELDHIWVALDGFEGVDLCVDSVDSSLSQVWLDDLQGHLLSGSFVDSQLSLGEGTIA